MGVVKQRGNMYEFVTHEHSHLRGGCPHECSYCYVKSFKNYERDWTGPVRLLDEELGRNYGTGKTLFIEHCSDLFAEGVPDEFITKILDHCKEYPENKYLFQTKNTERLSEWLDELPPKVILGTTIETNRDLSSYSKAPRPFSRFLWLKTIREELYEKVFATASPSKDYSGVMLFDSDAVPEIMLTIEPIMQFDLDEMARMVVGLRPTFINIGADSKGHKLPEPTEAEVLKLVAVLEENGVHVNKKTNLGRLVKS